ncbi:bifunctional precorrin-2 dehydrogenase/sirohydrochlorin ferrochelatase [Croceicoccus sp. Ery5]|uniref:precorrin-2 dehydrogenase/sirohydrochlorin ferrochelatase family protein n=1 Tax=Croceicoccus sp. Ery5 TaxID=1703340 RepID=UPI001E39A9CD|nr:bifunctional precorrin-2 dehydrogenase/sirohydrochlorin ferrochelatase [Croceicoccus sp. Ery5]
MNSLPLFHRIADRKVVVLGTGEAAAAKRRLVERAGGICVGEAEAHHAQLAFIALEDESDAKAAAMRLRGKGLIVNVTDRPALCDFTVPSIVDRDPVIVAVGTGGASAGMAKMLRLRLERFLPQGLGMLATRLAAARDAIRARFPTPDQRRRALDAALREGGPLDPMAQHDGDAVDRWLAGGDGALEQGQREILLRSDDPDDLTLREARLLGGADVVIHDPNVPQTVLVRARADAIRVASGGDLSGIPSEGLIVSLRRSR